MAARWIALVAIPVVAPALIAAPLPDDPLFASNQWPLHNPGGTISPVGGTPFSATEDADIDAPEAWERTVGSPDVVVAIIDTGADLDHPDLAANLWVNPGEIRGNGIDDDGNGFIDDIHGWDFVFNDASPEDTSQISHGTRLAGFIGMVGDNGTGGSGVCWDVSLMILRVQGLDQIERATDYAIANGADVIHTSYGGHVFLPQEREALRRATDAGLLVITATGNEAINLDDFPFYPANHDLPGLLTIGASDQNDDIASFSNFGPNTVDLLAPGIPVWSTVRSGEGAPPGYAVQGGTSFAAPHVSGVAALMLSVSPELGGIEIANRIRAAAERPPGVLDTTRTGGRLSAQGVWSPDEIPPAPVSDLTLIDVDPLGAVIDFTAPGDDGSMGTAALFEVRLATREITEETWFDADRVHDVPGPFVGGEAVEVHIHRTQHRTLRPGHVYHVAVRAIDEAGNLSPLTQSLPFRTANVETAVFDDFETDSGFWETGGDWTRTLETEGYGEGRAYHNAVTPYAPNSDLTLTLAAPVSLSRPQRSFLLFESFESFENGHVGLGDGLAVEVSLDGVSWDSAALLHSTATPMRDHLVPLGRWAEQGPIHLRFRLFSDGDGAVGAGWWMDNLHIFQSERPVFSGRDAIIESGGPGGTEPLSGTFAEAGPGWIAGDEKSTIPMLEATRSRANSLQSQGSVEAVFRPWLTVPGLYEVAVTWGGGANAEGVSIEVVHAGGIDRQTITQDGPVNGDAWHVLGEFLFDIGESGCVRLRADTDTPPADGSRPLRLEADAVRWRLLEGARESSSTAGLGIH